MIIVHCFINNGHNYNYGIDIDILYSTTNAAYNCLKVFCYENSIYTVAILFAINTLTSDMR